MKKILIVLSLSFSIGSSAESKFLSINKQIYDVVGSQLTSHPKILESTDEVVVIEVKDQQIEKLSTLIHKKLKRCGGFSAHETLTEAKGWLRWPKFLRRKKKKIIFNSDYEVSKQSIVRPMVDHVQEETIRSMITKLSEFETRHYRSKDGISSMNFIRDTWSSLTSHRSDVTIESFKHKGFPQPSIILTIKGSKKPEEIIILGGHGDSISDSHFAPGADDNASGIASVTEVLRVLMDHNFQPERTIQFMAYAAEEVGLFGSKEIARAYKKANAKVVGVMQLDMTLYKGTENKDIILISDYTHKEQNVFLGKLIDEYVKVPWGFSHCGYGCSDHASWTAYDYPASFPFESTFDESSPFIHTSEDTLESHGGDASHAVNFSKLATAYLIELAI